MNRIFYMVIRNFFRVPIWFYRIWRMGLPNDTHTDGQRYDYLRNVVKTVNRTGRIKVEVQGVDNLPSENGFILFPNHQGLFDVLALMDACPNPFGVVVKKEAAKLILVKQVIKALNGFSIDRQDIKASMEIIVRMAGGTFKSAVNAKCPIVPVALIDCFKPFDENSSKKQTVQVCFLKPIYAEEYKNMKTLQIAELVHDNIQEKINQIIG